MSKEAENNIKAELNRHINSKLFQKFLVKEAAKLPDATASAKTLPRSSLRKSPERVPKPDPDSSEDDRFKSAGRASIKSISNRESSLTRRDPSPIYIPKKSPVRLLQPYYLEGPDTRRSHYDSPEAANRNWNWKSPEDTPQTTYAPVYTADPLLLKQHESTIARLRQDAGRAKEKYEGLLRGKNEEIRRMHKQLENVKGINGELLEKMEMLEENERKLANSKTERDILERKIHSIESECDNYRRQAEYAKECTESYKVQVEECERTIRNRTQDVERDLRTAKDRADDLERQLAREKERNLDLERKINKAKDRVFNIQTELGRIEERNKRLERDLQEAKDRLSYESGQQLRDTEALRRKIEELTQEITRKKERKNSYEETRKEFSEMYIEPRVSNVEYRRENTDYRRENTGYGRENIEYRKTNTERLSLPRKMNLDMRGEDGKKNFRDYPEFNDRRSDPISWRKNEAVSPKNRVPENLKGLEGKLMALQMDKNRLEDELAKIPPQGRRIAQIKRKEEIDLELEILNSNISTIKSKLRQFHAL